MRTKKIALPSRRGYNNYDRTVFDRRKYQGLSDAARHRAKVHDLQNKIFEISNLEKQAVQDRDKAQELYGKQDKKCKALMRSNETLSKKYNRILVEHEKQNRRLERLETLFRENDQTQRRMVNQMRGEVAYQARQEVADELLRLREQARTLRSELSSANANKELIQDLIEERDRMQERFEERIAAMKDTLQEMGWKPSPEFTEAISKVKERFPEYSEAQAEATLDIYKRFTTLELD